MYGGGGDPGGRVRQDQPEATLAGNRRKAPSPAGGGGVEAKKRTRKSAIGSGLGSGCGGGGGRRREQDGKKRVHAVSRGDLFEANDTHHRPNASNMVVAYTPNLIRRYGSLLRNISFLLPYDGHGKAYECPSDKINIFLKWSRCNLCLFFEWAEDDQRMICHMFNTLTEIHISFLINPAFLDESIELKVTNPLLSFSSNFVDDETWSLVKNMLAMMFSPLQEESASSDLYVFTRSQDSVYFRIFKISSIPAVDSDNLLVLNEVGLNFCLKLLDVHGASIGSARDQALDDFQSQIRNELKLCPIIYYSVPNDKLGCRSLHSVAFNNQNYPILLENGLDLSLFEGFSITLQEFLERNSFLKVKRIVGSRNDEECTFVRNISKSIIRSILSQLVELFASGKCLRMKEHGLTGDKILLKGSSAKFYGIEVMGYEEDQAKNNVLQVVELVTRCFMGKQIPADLQDDLLDLEKNPLKELESVRDSSSLMSAKEKKELLVHLHTEYKTNVRPAIGEEECNDLFKDIPYLNSWMNKTEDNEYLKLVLNLDSKKVGLKVSKVEVDERKPFKKGELQFDFMRNSDVHIPEKALKDGITPFRLSWSDYILTSCYPRYLRAMQKGLAPYLKLRKEA